MEGVTGSIPVAPTTHTGHLPICGDLPDLPAVGGLSWHRSRFFSLRRYSVPFFGVRSLPQKIPFRAAELVGVLRLRNGEQCFIVSVQLPVPPVSKSGVDPGGSVKWAEAARVVRTVATIPLARRANW